MAQPEAHVLQGSLKDTVHFTRNNTHTDFEVEKFVPVKPRENIDKQLMSYWASGFLMKAI